MKKLVLVLVAAMAMVPLTAFAQQSPPPMHGMHRMSRQQMQQMQQMHAKVRSELLAALTPANKQLLATIVGNLAVASSPDTAGAVKQLDAALSTTEKQAILKLHAQMRESMEAMHRGKPPMMGHMKPMDDPGMILLMMSSMHGPGMMYAGKPPAA